MMGDTRRLGPAVLLVALVVLSACSQAKERAPVRLPPALRPDPVHEVTAELVDGVQVVRLGFGRLNYDPSVIRVKAGIPVRIVADSERLSGCFRSLVIPGLGVSAVITEESNVIEFTPQSPGEFGFACSMGMGSGTVVVE